MNIWYLEDADGKEYLTFGFPSNSKLWLRMPGRLAYKIAYVLNKRTRPSWGKNEPTNHDHN